MQNLNVSLGTFNLGILNWNNLIKGSLVLLFQEQSFDIERENEN